MKKKVRTRIAPSPTGPMHCGNLRTALFNYLFAKKHGGEFLLRIEDTDQARFVEGAEEYVIDSLRWLGISPDDGVNLDGTAKYRQSEREYRSYVDILLASGHAYYAFDTKEELDSMKASKGVNVGYTNISRSIMKNSFTLSVEDVNSRLDSGNPYVIRFNTPENKEIKFTDSVKGLVSFNSNNMDDKVLFKSDGLPTYHLANIIDDHLMEITHVIRGEEWLSSTSLHIMLYEAFGWDKPEFCHLPLILGPDGKKLSKRHGDKYGFPVFPKTWDYINGEGSNVHVSGFEDFESEALINFLALLGWNPGGTKEIMAMDEMISLFDLDRINSSGAMFDIEKLKNFNAHYLRNGDTDFLFNTFIQPCGPRYFEDEDTIKAIVDIAKERSIFAKDLYSSVSYFFEPVVLDEDVVLKNPTEFKEIMELFLDLHTDKRNFNSSQIKYDLEELCRVLGFKVGKVMPDLRMAITGGLPGPHVDLTMEILGKEESLERILSLIQKTEKVAS